MLSFIVRAPELKTIHPNVRPARIGVLTNVQDPNWQESCRGLLGTLSGIWGERYSVIIPTDGETIEPAFWSILENFDPDHICPYVKTGKDVQRAEPEEFAAEVARIGAAEQANGIHRDPQHIEQELLSVEYDPWGPSLELQRQLRDRLAPFHFKDTVCMNSLSGSTEPGYPFTPISVILDNTEHAAQNTRIQISPSGSLQRLWIESQVGSTIGYLGKALHERAVLDSKVDFEAAHTSDALRLLMSGRSGSVDLSEVPWKFSMLGVGLYQPTKGDWYRRPAVVVVGDELRDFAVYHNLSAMREAVYWFPQSWLMTGDLRATFASLVRDVAQTRKNRALRFCSASLSLGELEVIRDGLDEALHARGGIRTAPCTDNFSELSSNPRVAYNWTSLPSLTQQLGDGNWPGAFDTPKPREFRKIVPYEHRWVTELEIVKHSLPRHAKLGTWSVRHPVLSTNEARAGARGLCYECPNVGYFGGDVDDILVRPNIFIPDGQETIEYLAKGLNWSTQISDKGFFSRDTVAKMGGLEAATQLIRRREIRELLKLYLNGKPKQGQAIAEGAKYLASDGRWFASLQTAIGYFGDLPGTKAALDLLLKSGILHRGTILECQFCRSTSWFRLADLSDQFQCKRCRRSQLILSHHAMDQADPKWYYHLDEIVYQALTNNVEVPWLALDYLRARASSFLYSEELEFRRAEDARPWIEIDICCVVDGTLTIGEAKSSDRIDGGGRKQRRSLEKYKQAATSLGARKFVLATTQTWSAETIRVAKEVFHETSIDVLPLTGSDLGL